MHIDDPSIAEVLRRIIWRVTADKELQEDLVQEALIHLWQIEARKPGQSRGWYLQSCRFRILDVLSQGRSLDSYKRRYGRHSLDYPIGPGGHPLRDQGVEEPPVGLVCAQDMLKQLFERLGYSERLILSYLADGFGTREIAAKLNCSHQSVSKHRKRIARMAVELDLVA